jgi:putative effector of murein hydrolase
VSAPETPLSPAPVSVTAPVAMGIAQRLGGLPMLAAVFAVAPGLAAHVIGTARAFQVDREAGTYAGLAFGLHALAAAFAMPLLAGAWRALAG